MTDFNTITGQPFGGTPIPPYDGSTIPSHVSDTIAPSQPTISLASRSSTTVSLNFSAPLDNVEVTQRILYRDGVQIKLFLNKEESYLDENLNPDTSYSYTLLDTDRMGNDSIISTALVVVTSFIPSVSTVRINCGPPRNHIDNSGNQWDSDAGYVVNTDDTSAFTDGGTFSNINASNPNLSDETDLRLIQDIRKANVDGTLEYDADVQGGFNYTLKIYGVEHHSGVTAVGERIFKVQVNGVDEIVDVDWFANSGNAHDVCSTYSSSPISVPGSDVVTLRISFVETGSGTYNDASVSAIELIQSPQPIDEIRISAGSPSDIQDSKGNIWLTDSGRISGGVSRQLPSQPINLQSHSLSDILDQSIVDSYVEGSTITIGPISVDDGVWGIQLLLVEPLWSTADSRLMNIDVNSVNVISNLDIIDRIKHKYVLTSRYIERTISGGSITIDIKGDGGGTSTNEAVLSAIKMSKLSGARSGQASITLVNSSNSPYSSLSDLNVHIHESSFDLPGQLIHHEPGVSTDGSGNAVIQVPFIDIGSEVFVSVVSSSNSLDSDRLAHLSGEVLT